ncbi:MAG: diphthamide synthesis protein [archaeon]|nr:diphthamide synthesis protein [archaeon]
METLFIEAKKKVKLADLEIDTSQLPKNIAIAYSVQYMDLAFELKKKLSKKHNITDFIQVLGCSRPKIKKTQAILLISSGKFHAINLAIELNLHIYLLEGNNITKVSEEEINHLKSQKKASYINFLNSKNIGILVSTKPGQENLKKALEIKKKLKVKYKDKKSYILIANNINTQEFENFNINSWINTACSRLEDNKIINSKDIKF